MSIADHKGAAYAFRELMRAAERDIAKAGADVKPGDIKPARIVAKRPDLKKTHIGWFKRRLLRGEFRRRA